MNYSKVYTQLMERARNRSNIFEYETHHVLPKSLGGANTRDNLVKLTLREHFVAHRLLTKIHTGTAQRKMYFAYYRLSNRHQTQNSRFYALAKQESKKYLSKVHSGKTISEEHKQAIREKCRGMVGQKHSNASLTIMSQKKKGNMNAKIGVIVRDADNNIVQELSSIAELMTQFNISRGQAEHYIYNKRAFNGYMFERKKIITRK